MPVATQQLKVATNVLPTLLMLFANQPPRSSMLVRQERERCASYGCWQNHSGMSKAFPAPPGTSLDLPREIQDQPKARSPETENLRLAVNRQPGYRQENS